MNLCRTVVGLLFVTSLVSCSKNAEIRKDVEPSTPAPAPLERLSLTRDAAFSRARQVAKVNYQLWFGLDDSRNTFQGNAVVTFEFRENAREVERTLTVDLDSAQIRKLSLNGRLISGEEVSQKYDGQKITLPVSELLSGSNRLEVSYERPYSTDGSGLHRFQDPADQKVYLYTHFEPFAAHRVFPCFDQPDLKASFEVSVEAPKDWVVVSNSPERTITKVDGRRSWQFPPTAPFSTYLFALHAGPYHQWKSSAKGVPLRLFARKSLSGFVDTAEWFDVTRKGLDFFNQEFGVSYPFGKYDQIIVPDFNWGAMENVAAVTFSEAFVFRGAVTLDRRRERAETILHEMAHMWFGDLVTMRWWNGLWLNEGFATYVAHEALAANPDFQAGAWPSFHSRVKQWAYLEDQWPTTHPVDVPVADTESAFANFDGVTYGKGAAALRQLVMKVGPDNFKEGMQRYFERFSYRNATLSDLMNMLGQASGESLDTWQKQWLQAPGLNSVEAIWSCGPDEAGKQNVVTRFVLKQTSPDGATPLREHRTSIGLYHWPKAGVPKKSQQLGLKHELEASYSGEETAISEAVGLTCPDFVYPNARDYDYVKVQLDPISLETAQKHLMRIEDAFTRLMVWNTLWQMVRDGQMVAQDFIDAAISQLASEKDSLILDRVLKVVSRPELDRASAMRFLSPAVRQVAQEKFEQFTRTKLQSSPHGSDEQKVWFRAFVRASATEKAKRFLEQLYEGKKTLAGIDLDPDRRWEVLISISRLGSEHARGWIKEELARDTTDAGRKRSFSAEAAFPEAGSKDTWLSKAFSFEHKLSESEAAASHLFLLGQEDLLRPLAPKYFEVLKSLSAKVDAEATSQMAENAFPALCDMNVVALTENHLSSFSASVQKTLRIAAEEERICVRAREKSAGSVKIP